MSQAKYYWKKHNIQIRIVKYLLKENRNNLQPKSRAEHQSVHILFLFFIWRLMLSVADIWNISQYVCIMCFSLSFSLLLIILSFAMQTDFSKRLEPQIIVSSSLSAAILHLLKFSSTNSRKESKVQGQPEDNYQMELLRMDSFGFKGDWLCVTVL